LRNFIAQLARSDFPQPVRFALVGILASAVYFTSTTAFYWYASFSIPLATSISFVVVITLKYILHYAWTFRSERSHVSVIPRFLTTAIAGLIINYVVVLTTQRHLPISQSFSVVLGVCVVSAWNYFLGRVWVFAGSDTVRRQG
jgi:putative flippase GtrA